MLLHVNASIGLSTSHDTQQDSAVCGRAAAAAETETV